jgi:hypothetical protein
VTLVFRRLGPHAAVRAFRRGEVDEAPVPLGDIRAALADSAVRERVHVRRLLGLDLVAFNLRAGPVADFANVRRAYGQTAPRVDYRGLVAEDNAPRAFGLVADAPSSRGNAAAARRGAKAVALLPALHVPIVVDRDPDLVYGARLVVAHWRELGLGPTVAPASDWRRRVATGRAGAWFRRLIAAYPEPEALLGALLLPRDGQSPWHGRPSPAEQLLWRALASVDQTALLADADAAVEEAAAVVPLAWVVDARLVSPRLRGWSEDVLGDVDYTTVRPPG